MALKTKIVVQQAISVDPDNIIVGKYPRYVINMGSTISSITATELATAVDQAQTAAANAEESEQNAKVSETAAKDSENAAKVSEQNASTSESNAAASENAAKTSEENAAASEQAAASSANSAETAKTAAEAARDAAALAATNAAASESAAKTSEENAASSEQIASTAASAAKTSEENAKTSEENAADSEATAKTEADRAEAAMAGKLGKEDIAGFFKGYKTKADADLDVASRVANEKVLVWNENGPKFQWYKVVDTTGTKSLELVTEESKLLSVNNIRPDTTGNVQVTIPGGNPSLWLGEVTWFPYDKDNTIGYSGLLLADGREVRRVDFPDMWVSIETGLVPSVTEQEWQSGSNMYFSTGDGSTTFRLPNFLQGQAFRAAEINEANTNKVFDQIPYITSVNGETPDDESGAVVINVSGLRTGSNEIDISALAAKIESMEAEIKELKSLLSD